MKLNEILQGLEEVNYNLSLRDLKPREHYKFIATVCNSGFPTTKPQALFFKRKIYFGNRILNFQDVLKIENLLNKHGFFGDYKFTKNKIGCRIQNNDDVILALKKEFSI